MNKGERNGEETTQLTDIFPSARKDTAQGWGGEVLRPEKSQVLSSLRKEWWEMRSQLLKGIVCHAKNFKSVPKENY